MTVVMGWDVKAGDIVPGVGLVLSVHPAGCGKHGPRLTAVCVNGLHTFWADRRIGVVVA